MSWDYRVCRMGEWYGIHEVYYDEGGQIELWTVEPVPATGHTPDALKRDLAQQLEAFAQPPLDLDVLEKEASQ